MSAGVYEVSAELWQSALTVIKDPAPIYFSFLFFFFLFLSVSVDKADSIA